MFLPYFSTVRCVLDRQLLNAIKTLPSISPLCFMSWANFTICTIAGNKPGWFCWSARLNDSVEPNSSCSVCAACPLRPISRRQTLQRAFPALWGPEANLLRARALRRFSPIPSPCGTDVHKLPLVLPHTFIEGAHLNWKQRLIIVKRWVGGFGSWNGARSVTLAAGSRARWEGSRSLSQRASYSVEFCNF